MSETTKQLVTISIKGIEEKKTSTGKTYWRATDEPGDYYSIWDEKIKAQLVLGPNALEIEVNDKDGKSYKNIVGIATLAAPPANVAELLPGAPVTTPSPPASSAQAHIHPDIHPALTGSGILPRADEMDIRKVALSCAVQLFVAGKISQAKIEDQAEEFAKYIVNGKIEQNSSSGMTE